MGGRKKFLGKGESIPDDTDALLLSPSVPLNRPLVKACKEKTYLYGRAGARLHTKQMPCGCGNGNKRKDDYGKSNQSHTAQCGQVVLRAGQHRRSVLFDVRKLGEEDIAVLEASSFQLESCTRFAPYISAI